MFDTAAKIWQKIQEFVKDINLLKAHDLETNVELERLKREINLVQKELNHNDKIQDAQARDIEGLHQRLKKLESEKHGLAVKLGKEKKKTEKLSVAAKH